MTRKYAITAIISFLNHERGRDFSKVIKRSQAVENAHKNDQER